MPSPDLSGQAAVVTGSTSGIGLALARGLAAQGCDVLLNGLGEAAEIESIRSAIEAEHGVAAAYHPANMLAPDQIADMVGEAHRRFGRLDILVNNAGVQHVEAVEAFSVEQWDRIIAINLTSVFHASKAAAPLMKARGRGRIVNIASVHGLVASPFKSAYVAAKHGVIGFTKTLALEVAQAGITCNAICPGYVKTPLVVGQIKDQARTRGISEEAVVRDVLLAAQPTKRFVEFDQLIGALLYIVSDAGASMNGAAMVIDGGWTAQ